MEGVAPVPDQVPALGRVADEAVDAAVCHDGAEGVDAKSGIGADRGEVGEAGAVLVQQGAAAPGDLRGLGFEGLPAGHGALLQRDPGARRVRPERDRSCRVPAAGE